MQKNEVHTRISIGSAPKQHLCTTMTPLVPPDMPVLAGALQQPLSVQLIRPRTSLANSTPTACQQQLEFSFYPLQRHVYGLFLWVWGFLFVLRPLNERNRFNGSDIKISRKEEL